MAKSPFERIFSQTERKKILARVLKDKVKILIKNSKSEIFELKAEQIDSAFNLYGPTGIKDFGSLKDFQKVTALFYLNSERYFLNTRIKFQGDQWILLNDPNFYKFNRRTAYRINIPDHLEIIFQVTTVRNIEMKKKISVVELSSGGARFRVIGDIRFSNGTILKGSLQWGKGKVLPVDAMVVHSITNNIIGVRFVNLNSSIQNRLKMLSVEIQQTIHFT